MKISFIFCIHEKQKKKTNYVIHVFLGVARIGIAEKEASAFSPGMITDLSKFILTYPKPAMPVACPPCELVPHWPG